MANELTKIPKFRRCVLQNFPFIEQDFDALTDYQLLCKVVEYLNKVITSQNELIEVTESLTAAFNQLQSYVENYFENLDVQEEVNNKLDEMAEDGTLQEIITAYIQANVAWTFDSVEAMKAGENFVNGSYAQTLGFYSAGDGGSALYKIRNITNEDVVDNITIIAITASETLCAELVITKNMVADQFGAKGDGEHDDSDNIQAYIDHATTGFNVHLNTTNKQYLISKTLDFNGKGLIGTGYKIGDNSNNGLLFVDSDNYTNNNAIVNLGKELKDVVIKSSSTTLDCIHVSGFFNNIIDSVSIHGFSTQILVDGITVACRIVNSNFAGFNSYAIRVKDNDNRQSTTTWFDKCEFSYANGHAIKFDKEIYDCSFNDVIFESTNGGIQAKVIYQCQFNNIWCELTQDTEAHDWLINDTAQQIVGCTYTNLRIKSPWTNRANASVPSNGNTTGGLIMDSNTLCVASSTGRKTCVKPDGISTSFVDGDNSYGRCLTITTQDNVGNHKIPLRIKAPNEQLFFENQDDSGTPIVQKFVISKSGNTLSYASHSITTRASKTTYTDPETSVSSQYSASRVFVFNPQHQTVNNGGYTLTKDNGNSEFTITKLAGYTENLRNPSIVVSGILTDYNLGNLSYPVIPAFKLDEPYSGAYGSYSTASGIHIKFYKLDGTVIMPTSFTVHITEEN